MKLPLVMVAYTWIAWLFLLFIEAFQRSLNGHLSPTNKVMWLVFLVAGWAYLTIPALLGTILLHSVLSKLRYLTGLRLVPSMLIGTVFASVFSIALYIFQWIFVNCLSLHGLCYSQPGTYILPLLEGPLITNSLDLVRLLATLFAGGILGGWSAFLIIQEMGKQSPTI